MERREREGLKESIKGLEKRMKNMEMEIKKEKRKGKVEQGRKGENIVMKRVKEIKRRMERKER